MSEAVNAERRFALAQQATAQQDHPTAIQHLEHAIALEPLHSALHLELGNRLIATGDTLRALASYREALRLDPTSAHAWNNSGNLLLELRELDTAAAFYRSAAQLAPADHGIQYNLGRALDLIGEHAAAAHHLHLACELNPTHADSWINLGNACHNLGQFDRALACFDRALPLAANPAEVHVNRAMILLNQGRFPEGWLAYEQRWNTAPFLAYKQMPFDKPQWHGEPLTGKRLLLHAEQGFGDTIQFIRFLPVLRALGATITLEVPAPLKPLLATLLTPENIPANLRTPLPETLISRGDPRPPYDLHSSLISLPYALKLDLAAIPTAPYLSVPQALRAPARQALDQASANPSALRVGLSWTGNLTHRWNRIRSVSPAQLSPLAAIPNVEWFSLQKDASPQDLASLPSGLHLRTLPTDHLDGFLPTAAILNELDLVISIDTVTAHLTGALGKPLWLLLPAFYDWRWHAHLDHSPWYPSARLFRQTTPGDWTAVLERLATELTAAAIKKAATQQPTETLRQG